MYISIRFYFIKLSHIGLNKISVLFLFFKYETLIKSKLFQMLLLVKRRELLVKIKLNVARYYNIKIQENKVSEWSFSIIVYVKRIPEPLTQFLEKAYRRDYNKPVQGGLSPNKGPQSGRVKPSGLGVTVLLPRQDGAGSITL